MEKKGVDYLHFEVGCKILNLSEWRHFALFSPLPSILRVPISRPRPAFALFPCVNSADSGRGGGGGDGLGSPLAGISPNKEIRFFDDFSILI
jgi:hypothetical protein